MLEKYTKIKNVFEFSSDYKSVEDIQEPFKTLKDIEWYATEKIDGTNTRIYWDGYKIEILGRTEKSVWDKDVIKDLEAMFKTEQFATLMEQNFGSKEVILFGETYGPKIQGGQTYSDKREFRLFDIKVDGHDLAHWQIKNIASKLGINYVIEISVFKNLLDAIKYVTNNNSSHISNTHEMEGIVIRPLITLYDKDKEIIKAKIRWEDIKKVGVEKAYEKVERILSGEKNDSSEKF